MIKLATHLRYMQFYAHNAHNLCQGDTFFSDHEELGDLYGTYTGLYDSIVERMIGLGQSVDLVKIQVDAAKMLDGEASPKSFSAAFSGLLTCERELCSLLNEANTGASLGTQNLVQGICDDSEVRQYKFKQKLSQSGTSAPAAKEEAKESPSEEAKEEAKEAKAKKIVKLLTTKR
jgi:DNA-binding ferritin-like protein